jgi:hypothetical protein
VDPLTKNYPWYTPYQFAGNKPINSIDLDGLEEYESHDAYAQDKGNSALKTMDGSDGAWLTSDRTGKTATWSNAMAAITRNNWTDKFKSYSMTRTCEECKGSSMLCLGVPEYIVRKVSGHAQGSKEFCRYVLWAQTYQDKEMENMFDKLKAKTLKPSI